jgi:hypothetical protein
LGNFLKRSLNFYNSLNIFTPNQLQISLYKYLNLPATNNLSFPLFFFNQYLSSNKTKGKIINFPVRKPIVNFFKTNIILLNSTNLNGAHTRKYQKHLEIGFNSKFDNSNLNEVVYNYYKKKNNFSYNLKNSVDLQNQLKKLFKKIN